MWSWFSEPILSGSTLSFYFWVLSCLKPKKAQFFLTRLWEVLVIFLFFFKAATGITCALCICYTSLIHKTYNGIYIYFTFYAAFNPPLWLAAHFFLLSLLFIFDSSKGYFYPLVFFVCVWSTSSAQVVSTYRLQNLNEKITIFYVIQTDITQLLALSQHCMTG